MFSSFGSLQHEAEVRIGLLIVSASERRARVTAHATSIDLHIGLGDCIAQADWSWITSFDDHWCNGSRRLRLIPFVDQTRLGWPLGRHQPIVLPRRGKLFLHSSV